MATTTAKGAMVGGIAVIGGLISGVASLVVAVFAFGSYNWISVGVCLGAAGLAFGLIANAVWRD